MTINILGISGSPRKASTDYAVREALRVAEEIPGVSTRYWSLKGKRIEFCTHCDRCIREKTLCYIQDDITELIDEILEADGIIIGTPVYDMGISAQLTALFNRTRPFYMVKPGALRNKIGGAIALGGSRDGGQTTAIEIIHHWYLMSEILVTGGVSGCYNGGTVWTNDERAEGARKDTLGMNSVYGLGRAVAEAAMIAAMGRKMWSEEKSRLGIKEIGPMSGHEAV